MDDLLQAELVVVPSKRVESEADISEPLLKRVKLVNETSVPDEASGTADADIEMDVEEVNALDPTVGQAQGSKGSKKKEQEFKDPPFTFLPGTHPQIVNLSCVSTASIRTILTTL